MSNYITIWAVRCTPRATRGATTVKVVALCPKTERGWTSLAEELHRCGSDSHSAAYYTVFFIQL
jgi:hypothetical protein